MQDCTLTLTGGWAIVAIACIIHFIIVSVCGIVEWLETRKIKKSHTYISLTETAESYKAKAKSCPSETLANEYMAIWAWLIELRNRRIEEDMEGCYEQLKKDKGDLCEN